MSLLELCGHVVDASAGPAGSPGAAVGQVARDVVLVRRVGDAQPLGDLAGPPARELGAELGAHEEGAGVGAHAAHVRTQCACGAVPATVVVDERLSGKQFVPPCRKQKTD